MNKRQKTTALDSARFETETALPDDSLFTTSNHTHVDNEQLLLNDTILDQYVQSLMFDHDQKDTNTTAVDPNAFDHDDDDDDDDDDNNNIADNSNDSTEDDQNKSRNKNKKKTTVLKQNAHAQRRYRERIKQKSELVENQLKELKEKVKQLEAEVATQAPSKELLEHKNQLYESQLSMFKRARRAEVESATPYSQLLNINEHENKTPGELLANGSMPLPKVPSVFSLPTMNETKEAIKNRLPTDEDSNNANDDKVTTLGDNLESLHYQWLKQVSVLSITNIEEKERAKTSKGKGKDGGKTTTNKEVAEVLTSEESVDLISKMVDETCVLCMHIGLAMKKSDTCFDQYDNMGFLEDFDVFGKGVNIKLRYYASVIQNLGLSAIQKATLLQIHDVAKEHLRKLFEARERINKAMKGLCQQGKQNAEEGPKGLIRWLTGSSDISRSLILELRANLIDERALLIDISMDVVHKVLEPKQASRYLTEMYPLHPYGLVLCNALKRLTATNTES